MSEKFTCKNGQEVKIDIDDSYDFETTVFGPDGEKIGEFCFRQIDDFRSYLKLSRMYLDLGDDKWKDQGIGREILKRVKEFSGLPIVVGEDYGNPQDDGSHQTGDAPGFIAKMRKEGIVEDTSNQ